VLFFLINFENPFMIFLLNISIIFKLSIIELINVCQISISSYYFFRDFVKKLFEVGVFNDFFLLKLDENFF